MSCVNIVLFKVKVRANVNASEPFNPDCKAMGNYVSNLAHTYSFIIFAKIVHIWMIVIFARRNERLSFPLFKNVHKTDSGNVHVTQK